MLRTDFFVGEDNTNTTSSLPLDPLSQCFSVEFLLSDENGAVLFIGAASLRHNLDRTDPLLLPWPINALSLVCVLDAGSGGHSYYKPHMLVNAAVNQNNNIDFWKLLQHRLKLDISIAILSYYCSNSIDLLLFPQVGSFFPKRVDLRGLGVIALSLAAIPHFHSSATMNLGGSVSFFSISRSAVVEKVKLAM